MIFRKKNALIRDFQIIYLFAHDDQNLVISTLEKKFPDHDFTNQTVAGIVDCLKFSAMFINLHMVNIKVNRPNIPYSRHFPSLQFI